MLEEADSLGLDEGGNHVGENGANGVEALVRLANVLEAKVVEENLLDNEDGDRLGELRASLHDAEAEGDDLGREEEVDDVRVVVLLDESANDTQRRQAEVLEWTSLARCVEEWVEEEGDVGVEEETTGLRVGRDTLEKGKSVAHAVGRMRSEHGGRQGGVDVDNLEEERGHDA